MSFLPSCSFGTVTVWVRLSLPPAAITVVVPRSATHVAPVQHTWFVFFNGPSTTEIYALSLPGALPIYATEIACCVEADPGAVRTVGTRSGVENVSVMLPVLPEA